MRLRPEKAPSPAHPAMDSIRLAVAAVREAADLAAAFEEMCVGAARITGGTPVLFVVTRAGGFDVAAGVGRISDTDRRALVQRLALAGPMTSRTARPGDPMVAPVTAEIGSGALVVQRPRKDTLPALALFAELVGGLLDLRVLRSQAATAAHRVQPAGRVSGTVASLRPGDGMAVVALDDLEGVAARAGEAAADSVFAAAGAHLLAGTRPPGDVVVAFGDRRFLVVLRQLKAPVDAVVRRLHDEWMDNRPVTSLSIGAALHLPAAAPLETLERAEAALTSARGVGGGQAHVAPASTTHRTRG